MNSVTFSKLYICTITSLGRIYEDLSSDKKVLLDKLYEKITLTDGLVGKKFNNQTEGITRQRSRVPARNFYNCASFVVDIGFDRRITIKLFRNGRLQITGCKAEDEIYEALDVFMTKLWKTTGKREFLTKPDEQFIGIYEEISMINSYFVIEKNGKSIQLDNYKTYDIISQKYKIANCSYNPIVYTALKVKYKCTEPIEKDVTISIFQTGKVVITGATCMEHLDTCYKFITDVIYNEFDNIEMK